MEGAMTIALNRGDLIRLDGNDWRFTRRSSSGEICLEDAHGTIRHITEATLRKEYLAGRADIGIPDTSSLKSWQSSLLWADLASLPNAHRRVAQIRKTYVDRILRKGSPRPRARTWEREIRLVWEELRNDRTLTQDELKLIGTRPPTWHTVARWMTLYQTFKDIRCLVPGYAARGARSKTGSEEEEALFETALELWLRRERPSKQWAFDQLVTLYQERQKVDPRALLWKIPSRATVYRRLAAQPSYKVMRGREGKRAADLEYHDVKPENHARYRLHFVEIDHTRADVFLVDEQKRPLGRPWITVAIDRLTRMIVGVYIGFEPPSAYSVSQCLRSAMEPKDEINEMLKDYGLEWKAYGVPVNLVVDNAREFIGPSFRDAAAVLNITIVQSPVKQPQFKGKIERWFGTLSRNGLGWIPGKTFSDVVAKGDYDPAKHAILTLSEFRQIFYAWMLVKYCHKRHSVTLRAPAEYWDAEVAARHIKVARRQDLDTLLGLLRSATAGRQGIRFRSIFYQSPELQEMRRTYMSGSEVVKFKVNPGDLGHIDVIHPRDGRQIRVPAAVPNYARGLSLYQHNLIRAMARKAGIDYENQKHLVEARQLFEARCRELLARRKRKNAPRIARAAGYGVTERQGQVPREMPIDVLGLIEDGSRDWESKLVEADDAAEDAAMTSYGASEQVAHNAPNIEPDDGSSSPRTSSARRRFKSQRSTRKSQQDDAATPADDPDNHLDGSPTDENPGDDNLEPLPSE
jgi:putative transposase